MAGTRWATPIRPAARPTRTPPGRILATDARPRSHRRPATRAVSGAQALATLGRVALGGRRPIPAARALAKLQRLRTELDLGLEPVKWELLWHVWAGRLRDAGAVRRFHDLLCFMQAYVESGFLFALARRMLTSFPVRYSAELARHRAALVNSGIAGTRIRFPFYS